MWLCQCDCGDKKAICAKDLKRGGTVGCGCGVNPTIDHRLWFRIRKDHKSGCWLWQGAIGSAGYGKIGTNRDGVWDVHRFVFEQIHGTIPIGLCVLHRCDKRLCCNPTHLFLGTQAENMADMARKGRSTKSSHGRNGKLNPSEVREIRARYANGGTTFVQLASEYGVVFETIGDIVQRKTWKTVS